MSEADGVAEVPSETEGLSPLDSGEFLRMEDCYAITAKEPSLFVVLAGPSGAGKTTFLINLIDLFQRAEIKEYLFAGSKSLIAYSRRLNVFWNGNPQHLIETTRTPNSIEPQILHLRVASAKNKRERINLLIGDISGELFQDARDSAQVASELTFLKSADALVFFVDSKPIGSESYIDNGINDTRLISRRFREAKLLGQGCSVQAALSRKDLLGAGVSEQKVLENVDRLVVSPFDTTNPTRASIALQCKPIGETKGVVELLSSLLAPRGEAILSLNPERKFSRYFQNFGLCRG